MTRKDKYQRARQLGYTPTEAKRMRDWSADRFDAVTEAGLIVNAPSRKSYWARESDRGSLDEMFVLQAQDINAAAGMPSDSSYGYAFVYYGYTEGLDDGEINDIIRPDPFTESYIETWRGGV